MKIPRTKIESLRRQSRPPIKGTGRRASKEAGSSQEVVEADISLSPPESNVSIYHFYHQMLDKYPRPTLAGSGVAWILLLVWSYFIGFFSVIFCTTILIAMYLSLGEKKKGEISAYSVFNPKQRRLLGQLTPEHFERELLQRHV